MGLPDDLLHQARRLATAEPKRPRQASLRRAISAAYYSLFHLLAESAVHRWIGGAQDREKLRSSLRRAFVHTTMGEACREIVKQSGGKLKGALAGAQVPQPIVRVAQAFVDLQQARHDADYDLSHMFTRQEALDLIDLCDTAHDDWKASRKCVAADVLCAALIAFRGMTR